MRNGHSGMGQICMWLGEPLWNTGSAKYFGGSILSSVCKKNVEICTKCKIWIDWALPSLNRSNAPATFSQQMQFHSMFEKGACSRKSVSTEGQPPPQTC